MSKVRFQSVMVISRNGFTRRTLGGFTLTEMLLVIALIAVLSGLGGGFYIGTYKRMLVERAAKDFLLAAKYARIMAIEKQQNYELQIDPNGAGFMLIASGPNPDTNQTGQTVVRDYYFKPVRFEGDVRFEAVKIGAVDLQPGESEEKQSIVFQPTGCADMAIIQIGDGRTHYSIGIVTATGKATMYFGTADQVTIGFADLDAQQS